MHRTPWKAGLLLLLLLNPSARAQENPDKARLQAMDREVNDLFRQGKYQQAVALFDKLIPVAVQTFGPDHPEVATYLNNLAVLYDMMGRYAEAEPNYRRSLKILEAKLGPDHPEVASILNSLAKLSMSMGKSAEAEPLFRRSLKIRETALGPDHLDVAQSLDDLAGLYKSMGRYAQAEPLYTRSLKIREAKLGPDHPDVATSLNNLASAYEFMGKYAEAEPLYRRCLKIGEAALGPDHPDVATYLNNLAGLYKSTGKYAEAEPLYRRCLKIREATSGPDDPVVAINLNNLGSLYEAMGKYAEAEPLYLRSLKIRETALGPDHPDVGASLNNLAGLYKATGRLKEAEPLYRRCLKIGEAALGPDHPTVAIVLNNQAELYRAMGKYAEAEPLLRRSLKIREAVLGPDHPDVASSLGNLAALCSLTGRYAEAETLYRRNLKIWEAALGPDHPDVAANLNNLASVCESMGKYAEAETLFRRSLRIGEAKLGPGHPAVAETLNNLAALDSAMGRSAEAEPLLRRSLTIREAALGPDHPDVATSLNNLGVLYDSTGRYAEAEPLHRRSLKIREAALGPDHPVVASGLNNLASLVAALGRWDEAAALSDRARRGILAHVSRVLPALSESDQLAFLKTQDEPCLHGALSVALARRTDPRTATLSAGWVLNGKALAQQTLAERALLARDVQAPGAAPLARQLAEVRNELAALTLGAPRSGQEASRRERLVQLAGREQELSRQLGQAAGRPARDDPWVGLEEVRAALPQDAILVEVVRFAVFDFKATGQQPRWQPPRYAAWVIPTAGRGDVRMIDLGDARAIEDAVAAARTLLKVDANALRARGEDVVERESRKPLLDLARLVLVPLLPQIGPSRRWVISPDASLWLVPWAALPTADGRYAVEDHTIQYVVSGRDLIPHKGPPAKGQALIMADPDYDLDPAQGRDSARQVLRDRETPPSELLALRGLSDGFAAGSVPRLPGTAAEARAITPGLRALAGAAPLLYSDRWALEAIFKAFRSPRVVVLSTHGFFRDDQETKPDDRQGRDAVRSRRPAGPLPENPLLRCGLLLAGCNRRDMGGGEDGVLTGLEIVGTDLRGTDLVVLSACETGLGQVRNGEGVAGLRQAFQLAGARSVVATLWQVPDKESARLMTGFFDNLAAGKGKADALREAQLAQIKSRRERFGAAHPFFWAAFTITGRGL